MLRAIWIIGLIVLLLACLGVGVVMLLRASNQGLG